jgi:nucleoside phosphorylase
MRVGLESFRGKIDFAVISIREDEFLAVLERFAPDRHAMGNQRYEIGTVRTNSGGHYTVAAVRCVEQGQGYAQKVATDLISDLEPRWLLVVGIGGAVPSMDFTLGDVVCATRVHNFSIRAVKEGAPDAYSAGGGPMHPEIQRLLASLPAIVMRELVGWNSLEALGTSKPTLRVPGPSSDKYYGDEKWKAELRRTLLNHFPKDRAPRSPLVTSRSVATSDALVKSTDLLSGWQEYARDVAAVEMELGGIFLAARQIHREYPILAIRGISDIVGFKREERWTKYACSTAAAFAYALLCAGAPFDARVSPAPPGAPLKSPAQADLIPKQFAMLRDAVATFNKFVAIEDSAGRFSGGYPNTVVLLHLPEVDQRLGQLSGISFVNAPDVRWANRMAGAVVRARDCSRGFRGYTANEHERDALRGAIRELRDLITDQYPGLLRL